MINFMRHREYRRYLYILDRLYNPNSPSAKWYSKKDEPVSMYQDWVLDPETFFYYIDTALGKPANGMQIDRIDNTGHYIPGNIQWVTKEQNKANRQKELSNG